MDPRDGLIPMPMSNMPSKRKDRRHIETSEEEEAESMLHESFGRQMRTCWPERMEGFTIDENHISPIDGLDPEDILSPDLDLEVIRSSHDRLQCADPSRTEEDAAQDNSCPRMSSQMTGQEWSSQQWSRRHADQSRDRISSAGKVNGSRDPCGAIYSGKGRPRMENVYSHISEYMTIDRPNIFIPPPPPPETGPPLAPPTASNGSPLSPTIATNARLRMNLAAAIRAKDAPPSGGRLLNCHDNRDDQMAPQVLETLLPLGRWSSTNTDDDPSSLFSPMASCCGSTLPRRQKVSALDPSTKVSSLPKRPSAKPNPSTTSGATITDAMFNTVIPPQIRPSVQRSSIKRYKTKSNRKNSYRWKALALLMVVTAILMSSLCIYLVVQKLNNVEYNEDGLLNSDESYKPTSLPGGAVESTSSGAVVVPYQLGSNVTHALQPHGLWGIQYYLPEPWFIRFRVLFRPDAILGVYGRGNLQPTHTQYDFFHTGLGGRTEKSQQLRPRKTRENSALNLSDLSEIEFSEFLDPGLWFILIYNDGNQIQNVTIFATHRGRSRNESCDRNCNGQGKCINGRCDCLPGYFGELCDRGRPGPVNSGGCPVLCNGRGTYRGGLCDCFVGWTGPECRLPSGICEDPRCGGNGLCVDGTCVCSPGYAGINCTEEICLTKCVNGRCRGEDCVCHEEWTGDACELSRCDARCDVHGVCYNGTCLCNNGWNGKHCSLEGCHKMCSYNGRCELDGRFNWRCNCSQGWAEGACDVAMEMACNDGIDDDKDGLVDCEDPDCCPNPVCRDRGSCQTVPDPLEILLRKQPPSSIASFFEHVRFLVEENSVQRSATFSVFSQSQASVVRGRVTSIGGIPMIGVNVSVAFQPLYGFTRTRDMGFFDILVNGGGAVTLSFERPPFLPKNLTILVRWNRMTILDPVTLLLSGQSEPTVDMVSECQLMDAGQYGLHPVVMTTAGKAEDDHSSKCPSCSFATPGSQVLQESLPIPGTDFNLVYRSSEVPGYKLTVTIQLTLDHVPAGLALVHLRIVLEGRVFEQVFEADPNLRYRFAWVRRNAYNQKVYGTTEATVYVGYEFTHCKLFTWNVQSVRLTGYAITSSEIGDWGPSIHHMYNFQEGILHKGDGTNIHLRHRPVSPTVTLGTGQARSVDCKGCDGRAREARLLAPVALAAGPDGSVYVGDYNFIRKLSANREEVASVLQLSIAEVPYKYYISVGPRDGRLYLSDYQRQQIIRVKTTGAVKDLLHNYEVIAGTGDQCMPGDANQCGDGGVATLAKLLHPKGLAVSRNGAVYFADGVNIRAVGRDGIIRTVIGSQDFPRSWQPLPCNGSVSASEVMLHWPTALAINPLDDSLYILDNNLILRLTPEKRVTVIAGHPVHCSNRGPTLKATRSIPGTTTSNAETRPNFTTTESTPETTGSGTTRSPPETKSPIPTRPTSPRPVSLRHPQHLSFAPNGDLYVVERFSDRRDSIRILTSDGQIIPYAGTDAECSCWRPDCDCSKTWKILVMTNASLRLSAELAVTPDGVIHVADSSRLQVLSVVPDLPQPDRSGQYEIRDPEAREAYVFNRYGQHIATRSLRTGRYVYNFTYNANSYYSKLTRITDRGGNVTVIQRDYKLQAKELVLQNGKGFGIVMDYMGRLQSFGDSKNSSTSFTYVGNTGLIRTKQVGRRMGFEYDYDGFGHLRAVVLPTGEKVEIGVDGSGERVVLDFGLRDTTTVAADGLSVGRTGKQGLQVMRDSGDLTES